MIARDDALNGTPFFSVVVPVYNSARYLGECIDSVRRQTFKDFELILVDDGSTDSSGAICDMAASDDCRIRVIHTNNQGALAARATGVDEMKGRYCLPLDSDDTITLNSLEIIYSAIDYEWPDLIFFGAADDDGNLISRGLDVIGKSKDLEALKSAAVGGHINTLWGKVILSSLAKCCLVNEGLDYNYAEDWFQVLSIVDGTDSYVVIPDLLYMYRLNSASTMNRYRSGNANSLSRTFSRLEQFANKWDVSLIKDAHRAEIDHAFLLLKSILSPSIGDDANLDFLDEFSILIAANNLNKARPSSIKQVFKVLCYKLIYLRWYKLAVMLARLCMR